MLWYSPSSCLHFSEAMVDKVRALTKLILLFLKSSNLNRCQLKGESSSQENGLVKCCSVWVYNQLHNLPRDCRGSRFSSVSYRFVGTIGIQIYDICQCGRNKTLTKSGNVFHISEIGVAQALRNSATQSTIHHSSTLLLHFRFKMRRTSETNQSWTQKGDINRFHIV